MSLPWAVATCATEAGRQENKAGNLSPAAGPITHVAITMMTPRCAMVHTAATSALVPISSTTSAWGVWFCTASNITLC